MQTNRQTKEPQTELFACIECDAKWDTDNLFVPEMSEMAEIKGEDDGPENAFIVVKDLPEFAVCAQCRDPDYERYTLASSIASCQAYHRHRDNRHQGWMSDRSRMVVTEAEANELVSCFRCEELGKKTTLISRRNALAPGWSGCNILKGRRRQLANPRDSGQKALAYVTSRDLLKNGRDSFVACPGCRQALIPELRRMGWELGLSEGTIVQRIRPQSLIAMIASVGKKERGARGSS